MLLRYQRLSFGVKMISRHEEDYLEAIYNIVDRKGYARTTDIAEALDVKPSSVTEMLQKLDSKCLIEYRKYEGAVLTKKGRKIGEAVKGRHDTLLALLKLLDVPEQIADKDACIMEHGLDPTTIIQLKKFIRFVKHCPNGTPECLKYFKEYSKTGNFPDECKK